MLTIRTAPTYEAERRYIFDVVLRDRLSLQWEWQPEERTDTCLTMAGDPTAGSITMPDVLFRTDPSEWLRPASLPAVPGVSASPVPGIPTVTGGQIPILFGRSQPGPVATTDGRTSSLAVDIFGSVFFLLSRYEEAVTEERDEHGRTLEHTLWATRTSNDGWPLADVYVGLLRDSIGSLWPGSMRWPHRYRLRLTHDVDLPFACRESVRSKLHSCAADVLRRHDPRLASQRLKLIVRPCDDRHAKDPWNVFGYLMDVAEGSGLTCTFNFLADSRGPGTSGYSLDDPGIRDLLLRIDARGHEIGLHGSYHDHSDAEAIGREFAQLRDAAGRLGIHQEEWGGRQHFLRWENPATWRAWDTAGLAYDSTIGFAERIGFRAGTCHPYRAFDLRQRRVLGITERPLIAMDTAWLLYAREPLSRVAERIIEASRWCRRFDGEFVGLWHNSELASAGRQRWYRQLVPRLL